MELLLWGVVGTIVGAIIGDRKGRADAGAILGVVLGPIGWIVVGLGPDYRQAKESKKCPFCGELVKREASVCKHCGRDLPPLAAAPRKFAAPGAQFTRTESRPRTFGAVLSAILLAAGIIAIVIWIRSSVVGTERAEKTLKDQIERRDAFLGSANQVYPTASPNISASPIQFSQIASASPPLARPRPNMVTIVKPVSVKVPYGIIGLPLKWSSSCER